MIGPTIRIALSPEAQALIERMQHLPETLAVSLVRGLNEANNRALRSLLLNHFTGVGPFPVGDHRLGQRTGHLSESLRATDAVIIRQSPSVSVAGSLGSNLGYLGPHEYGFNDQVVVREHLRHITIQHFEGKLIHNSDIDRLGLRRKDGKPRKGVTSIDKDVTVHEFTRWMQIPERAPLRTGLEENLPMYREVLSAAVITGMKGAGAS